MASCLLCHRAHLCSLAYRGAGSGDLNKAEFRQEALPGNILTTGKRKYNKSMLQPLLTTDWIEKGLNIVITDPTGVGKSYIATALGYMACRREQTVKQNRKRCPDKNGLSAHSHRNSQLTGETLWDTMYTSTY